MNNKPTFCPDEDLEQYLDYLDDLRESGDTNMLGARPWLMMAFPELSSRQASQVLVYWMSSFGERHTGGSA